MSTHNKTLSRKTKWQPPPPPTPKILHLPRRLKLHHSTKKTHPSEPKQRNLRSLLIEEKSQILTNACEAERWKAEAEMLRAQCESIRMERDAALRKLQKSKERKKIDGDSIEKKMGQLKLRSDEVFHNVREIREVESSCTAELKQEINVDILKRKMEVISKGVMERMEEYGSFLISASNANNNNRNISVTSYYSIGKRSGRKGIANQRQNNDPDATGCNCCFNCKEIVRRVVEEVKSESEQWTEMQEMLDKVRLEMDGLKSSRDLWKQRAIASDLNLRSLFPHMLEWKQRARASEQKITDLQKHIFRLEKSSWDEAITPIISTQHNLHSGNLNKVTLPKIKCQHLKQEKLNEKHMLVCRTNNIRLPLKDIGNSTERF